MTYSIAINTAGKVFNSITDALEEGRVYVDAAVVKATQDVKGQAHRILENYYASGITEVDKGEVKHLIDRVSRMVTRGQNASLVMAVACYVLRGIPFFRTLFTVGLIASFSIAYDLGQMHGVVLELKGHVKHVMAGDKVIWGKDGTSPKDIAPVICKCRALLQDNLIFLNQTLFLGQEIDSIPHFVDRLIKSAKMGKDVANVRWVPDRKENYQSLQDYLSALKQKVTGLIQDFSGGHAAAGDLLAAGTVSTSKVHNLVKEVLRPVACVRAMSIASCVVLYAISAYIPIFSTLTYISAIAAGFFAWEAHCVHKAIRCEVSDELVRKWDTSISWNELMVRIRVAFSRIGETTWFFNEKRCFGSEIAQLPEYLEALKRADGDFEHVAWRDGTMKSLIRIFKSAKVYAAKI